MSLHLPTVYKEISARAVDTPQWPASAAFRRLLSDGRKAPRFEEGRGPLAVAVLFSETDNFAAFPLVTECLAQFDRFVEEMRTVSASALVITSIAPHICVRVFQEHPSLLPEEERHLCKPVDDATVARLAQDLSSVLMNQRYPIPLKLDSLLLTPDGAMIAGFVDEISNYENMKKACSETAQACIGSVLTSRPKQLIHVTLGRFLGFEQDLSPDQQSQVQNVLRRFNQNVLPSFVASRKDPIITMQQMSLLRNDVWLCEENTIYKTWDMTTL